MYTLCACYLVDYSNGTMDNTAAVILLYRQVTGSAPSNAPLIFTYLYVDDVLSINNPDFETYCGQMYSAELEIKDTTESSTSASYLDLLPSIGRDGQLCISLYVKHDDFNLDITNMKRDFY